jgi:hypothetical protein
MMSDVVIPSVNDLLNSSKVTEEFKVAVTSLEEKQAPNDNIKFHRSSPPVKVLRAICGLLEHRADLAVNHVEVEAVSGCSDFRGHLVINGGEKKFSFVWDCAWKARELGWNDYFGDPDQIRAARTYGYQCFEVFEEVAS